MAYANRFCLLLGFVAILFGCYKDGVDPGQLLKNADAEQGSLVPKEWKSFGGDHVFKVSEEESVSPTKSLEISLDVADPVLSGYWYQHICEEVPFGKTLTLWVMVKGKDLEGEGINLFISSFVEGSTTGPKQKVQSIDKAPIVGTFDWTKYEVTLDKLDEDVACVSVFLQFLPNTTGTVYFDDIYLLF